MKKTKGKKASRKNITPELPQNIMPVGERVFEDKNIYIHQKVYEQIHKFSANKTENEHGGILVGRVLNEMGKENTIIEGFIEARNNVATPTTLTFTHETWEYFHSEIDRKYKDKKIVGWIHTHPNFGIFLSENDRFIQQNFFTDTNQVAYVVDPIQREEGFFFWINDNLERCPGFYLFDKNGAKIKQKPWDKEEAGEEQTEVTKKSSGWTFVLAVILAINLIITMYQGNEISKLQKKVADQEVILQYTMGGFSGRVPDLSIMAEDIRYQIELQRQAEEEEKKKQLPGGPELPEQNENGAENPEQIPAATPENNEPVTTPVPTPAPTLTPEAIPNETENTGGQE